MLHLHCNYCKYLFMKKYLPLFIVTTVLVVAATFFIGDGWIYSAAAVSAITIISAIRHFHLRVLKITRWAKRNPRKTQVFITVAQIIILALALLIGYDLKQLGYEISDTPTYIFGAILLAGFFSTRFLPKKKTIALPVAVNKDRVAYMSILLSSLVLMIFTGNRVEDKFPDTILSQALKSVDHALFSPDNFSDDEAGLTGLRHSNQQALPFAGNSTLAFASISPTGENSMAPDIRPEKEIKEKIKPGKKAQKFEKKQKRIMRKIEKLRKAFAAGASVGVILLVILLIIVCCAGICVALSGGGAGSVILGLLILGLAIFGIVKLLNRKPKVKEPKEAKT